MYATAVWVAIVAVTTALLATCVHWFRLHRATDGQDGKRREPMAFTKSPLYAIRGLRKDYATPAGSVTAVDGLSVDIGHEDTAILGPSGEGKTTTLNVIGGLDEPTAGQVWFKGVPVPYGNAKAMRRFRATKVAWVFQDLNLVSHLTVEENAALALLCRGVKRKHALAAARRHLRVLGIEDLARRYPHQLSGGQKQRVAIARAFTSSADVILADEPTGSLDPETARKVMAAFRDLAKSTGKPIVLVTHNHELARQYCGRILELTREGLRDVTAEHQRSQAVDAGPKRAVRAADEPAPAAAEDITFPVRVVINLRRHSARLVPLTSDQWARWAPVPHADDGFGTVLLPLELWQRVDGPGQAVTVETANRRVGLRAVGPCPGARSGELACTRRTYEAILGLVREAAAARSAADA